MSPLTAIPTCNGEQIRLGLDCNNSNWWLLIMVGIIWAEPCFSYMVKSENEAEMEFYYMKFLLL
jgi:hypothetical protein